MDGQTIPDPRAFLYYARLGKVKKYVEGNIDGDLSLNAVAQVAGMERASFSRFFRQRTGARYTDWVATLRVARAMDIMRSANRSITRVAFSVGFRNVRTFERAFKRGTSMTPSAFRKSVRPR